MTLASTTATSCGLEAVDLPLPWPRHTIDDSSRGADGVRLADVNGDGRLDITTGWEEGGRIRICVNPGFERIRQDWPSVTVGEVRSPEDAVLVDLDADGRLDVVSACEGNVKTVFVHWAPSSADDYLESVRWSTKSLPASEKVTRWMFCLPLQIDGKHGVDLVAGSKNSDGRVGWFEAPADPRRLEDWQWHDMTSAAWIMSLVAEDMDADGDRDIVISDRKGDQRGCCWLDNPGSGANQSRPWPRRTIGATDQQVMFLTIADLDRDGRRDVVVATYTKELVYLRRKPGSTVAWEESIIAIPTEAGIGKGVAVGDINLDGQPDIVFTSEKAGPGPGVMWMSYRHSPTDRIWQAHDISGPDGEKFDRVELVDLDGDGDLDVITCEERDNLGVFWYENPTHSARTTRPASTSPAADP